MPTDELLRELIQETKALRYDTTLQRSIEIGPYSLVAYRAANVDPIITLPATIQPQQKLRILGPADGPGGMVFAAITFSSLDFQLEVGRDNEEITFDAIGSTYAKSGQSFGPGIWMSQVDYANGLFSMFLNSGSTVGFPFFDNIRVHVRNTGATALALVSFLVVVRFVEDVARFKEAIARDRHQR